MSIAAVGLALAILVGSFIWLAAAHSRWQAVGAAICTLCSSALVGLALRLLLNG